MKMNVKENGDIMIIQLSGEVDAQSSPEIRSKIKSFISEGRNKLVVDLEEVTYIDSSVIGVLVGRLRSAREGSGDLKLAALQTEVQIVFELIQLDKVFKIFRNQEDAVQAFQNESTV